MNNIDAVLDSFMNGNYFIIFLALMLIIFIVLILSLIKSREDYNELLDSKIEEGTDTRHKIVKDMDKVKEKEEIKDEIDSKVEDLFDGFEALKATSKEDEVDFDKPIIKQIEKPITYENIIDEYEYNEEQNAIISADELEKKNKERLEALGSNDNRDAINKYEEEQEKKAIISYEQLLRNASNISLSYVEDTKPKKVNDAPKISKIEIIQKEISEPENYLEEEEFLRILKSFRMTL